MAEQELTHHGTKGMKWGYVDTNRIQMVRKVDF